MMTPQIIKTFRLSKFNIYLLPSSHLEKRLLIPSAKKVEKNIPKVGIGRKKKEAPIIKIQPKKEPNRHSQHMRGRKAAGNRRISI
jgi:hypothetical protein